MDPAEGRATDRGTLAWRSVLVRSLALMGVGVVGLAARSAHAQTPGDKATPAYVLSIWTDDADDQADALTQALRTHVRQRPGWLLLETGQSFETLAIALKCPTKPDPPCLLRIGDQLKTDHYVWGSVQKKSVPSTVSAELHLWSRGKPDALARQTYSDALKDPNSDSLRAVAASLFDTLTGTPSPKAVIVPAAPVSVAPAPEPSVKAPAVAAIEPVALPPPVTSERPTTRTMIGYSALVVGGGFLVAGGIEAANWIADSNANNDDRKSVPRNVTDVCTDPSSPAAQDACVKSRDASNVSTLGWIFGGVGVAMVATGVVLLVTGARQEVPRDAAAALLPSAEPRLEVLPSMGPRGGELGVRVRF